MTIQPPHNINDRVKLADMIKLLRRGESLPPVLVHGEQAYSGSHRISAWTALRMDIEYVEITDADYEAIMNEMNLDPMYDSVYDFEVFLDTAIELGFAGNAK